MPANLTPVFQACPPRHPELTGSSYAADLHRAIRNEVATPEGALDFFQGTYPAPAMKTACRMVFDRLHNGEASEQPAVYRFNSRYGGGKTHTLITLAAACLHPDVVRQEPEETPVPSHLATDSVRLIAFTGENVDPLSGAELDDSGNRAKSLTGHVAYHLGGPEALEQFREHDNRLTDPGAENFRRLIGDHPTLFLVDELVQWVDRVLQLGELNVQGIKTTIAALAKAVDTSPRAVLVVTSPEPGHDAFQNATAILTGIVSDLDSILSRTGHDMVPSDETDVAAILRQRLFTDWDEQSRQETTKAYAELWKRHWPADADRAEKDFYDCYPFHPSVLRIARERLANNPDFQRVRGTLRLLTATIRHNKDTTAPLIHPWHITPEDNRIRDELVNRIHHEAFDSGITADITGDTSTVKQLGDPLAEKAAKVILLGSLAPSANSGLSATEVVEAVMTPEDDDENVIRKAIGAIQDNALYIDNDPSRDTLRFTNEPNIRREIQLRRNKFSDPKTVEDEIKAAILRTFQPQRNQRSRNAMPVTVYPSRTGNAPDDPDRVHLAIVNPDHINYHSSQLQKDLLDLYQHSPGNAGQAQREHRNNVIFLLADREQDLELNDAVVRNLAAKDVKSLPPTDLKDYQAKIVEEDIAASNKHIHQAIQRNWIHLFFPSNDEQWSHSGSHLRHERLPASTDTEGDGQAAILDMLYAHHKMPQQTALRFNPTEWRQTRLRTGEPLTVGELHREFTANPGKWMILNRDVFNQVLDAAVKAGDLVIQTPTGEIIGEHHAGLHHANDFHVWLPQYAPQPPVDPDPTPPDPDPQPDPVIAPNPTGVPRFETQNVSAKVAVGQLADHMTSNDTDWTKIEQVTMQSASLEFLSYLASVVQGSINAKLNYECHSDDGDISLVLRNRSAEQWMQEQRTIERVNAMAGANAGDARVVILAQDNDPQAIKGRLEALDNSHDIQLTVTFA